MHLKNLEKRRSTGKLQIPNLSLLASLRLNSGDGDGIDNVFGFAAAREIVAWTVEALKDRADGGSAG